MKEWKIKKRTIDMLEDCRFCELKSLCNIFAEYNSCSSFLENEFQLNPKGGYPVYAPLEQIKERRF